MDASLEDGVVHKGNVGARMSKVYRGATACRFALAPR